MNCVGVQNKRSATDADSVSNDALRSMCENVLQLLSTTVDNMDIVSRRLSPQHDRELYGCFVTEDDARFYRRNVVRFKAQLLKLLHLA